MCSTRGFHETDGDGLTASEAGGRASRWGDGGGCSGIRVMAIALLAGADRFDSHQFTAMSARVEAVLGSLTLEEKVRLLAGKDFWETVPIPEKGVPAVKACGFASSRCDAPG